VHELQTDRLWLRPLTMDDLVDWHREIYADPEVVRHYSGRGVETVEQAQQRLVGHLAAWREDELGRLAVVLKASGEFLGQVHLDAYVNRWYRWADEPDPPANVMEVELAFAFGRRFWGQGYAFEACTAVIGYAFGELNLRRLVGGAHQDNARSHRLQRRLGFRVEPNLRPGADTVVTILDHPAFARC
jgi:ribosomal-protein-alanine N-acetyltransferase